MTDPIQKNLRVPRDMAPRIKFEADKQGISENTWMVAVIAGALRYGERNPDAMPVMHAWGGESHVEVIAERLGFFEIWHLEHELRMKRTAVDARLKPLLSSGQVVEDRASTGGTPTLFRWVGPRK